MKLTGGKRLVTEDFKSDDQELVSKLAYVLNPFLEQMTNAMNSSITVSDNLDMDYKDIIVTVDSLGIPVNNVSFQTTKPKVSGILALSQSLLSSPERLILSTITSGTPTEITTSSPHGFASGQVISLGQTDSTPTIDGNYKIIVLSPTQFQVPVTTSGGGSQGFVIARAQYPTEGIFVTFTQKANIVQIQHVTGLTPGIRYNLKLLVLGF